MHESLNPLENEREQLLNEIRDWEHDYKTLKAEIKKLKDLIEVSKEFEDYCERCHYNAVAVHKNLIRDWLIAIKKEENFTPKGG